MAYLTRSSRSVVAVIFLLAVSGIGCAGTSQRGPRLVAGTSARGARVVLVRGDRIYVASPDSVDLGVGSILTFIDRDKKVATAQVTAIHDGVVIAAELTSGSLAKVEDLGRLKIAAERPTLRAPSLLRVGYPASGRKNLLFNCSAQSPDSIFLLRAYRADVIAEQSYLFVRDTTHLVHAGWPDSLVVRLFDEVSDEEIALERGDLDVAVFWPGEASTHIREVMRWQGRPSGIWFKGTFAASARNPGVPTDSASLRTDEWRALGQLNKALFRGDLEPWEAGKASLPPSTVSARFEVDASIPGRATIELFLNRMMGGATLRAARVIRIFPVYPPQPGEKRAYDPSVTNLLVRCPVISAPELGPYLDAIGANYLANLFQCLPPPRKP